MVLKTQAEKLKVRFGSALPSETHENEIISIPGIAGREKKEISIKTLAHIINARVEEIVAQVYFEIRSSGYSNKLIAGIVITGGGSQLKHLKQMAEYNTGLAARIGFPTEHLAKDTKEEYKNPMYATGLGLILKGYEELESNEQLNKKKVDIIIKDNINEQPKTVAALTTDKKEHWWKKLVTVGTKWFEDERVNKDFDR